jgi:hypothetical protein
MAKLHKEQILMLGQSSVALYLIRIKKSLMNASYFFYDWFTPLPEWSIPPPPTTPAHTMHIAQ